MGIQNTQTEPVNIKDEPYQTLLSIMSTIPQSGFEVMFTESLKATKAISALAQHNTTWQAILSDKTQTAWVIDIIFSNMPSQLLEKTELYAAPFYRNVTIWHAYLKVMIAFTLDCHGAQEWLAEQLRYNSTIKKALEGLLVESVHNSDLTFAKQLLSLGVSANATGGLSIHRPDANALILAIENEKTDFVYLLLNYGADIELLYSSRFEEQVNALMVAAYKDDTDILRSLISRGAQINATNDVGESALMLAASSGQVKSVKILLEAGANPYLKDNAGKTALDLVKSALDNLENSMRSYSKEDKEIYYRRYLPIQEVLDRAMN